MLAQVGGGLIVTPLLALTMPFSQTTVLGTSLLSMIPPASAALAQHHRCVAGWQQRLHRGSAWHQPDRQAQALAAWWWHACPALWCRSRISTGACSFTPNMVCSSPPLKMLETLPEARRNDPYPHPHRPAPQPWPQPPLTRNPVCAGLATLTGAWHPPWRSAPPSAAWLAAAPLCRRPQGTLSWPFAWEWPSWAGRRWPRPSEGRQWRRRRQQPRPLAITLGVRSMRRPAAECSTCTREQQRLQPFQYACQMPDTLCCKANSVEQDCPGNPGTRAATIPTVLKLERSCSWEGWIST